VVLVKYDEYVNNAWILRSQFLNESSVLVKLKDSAKWKIIIETEISLLNF